MSAAQGPEGTGPRDEVDELFDAARALADRSADDDHVDWHVVRRGVRRRRILRTAAWACSTAVLAGAAVWLGQGWTDGVASGEGPATAASPVAATPSPPGVPEYRLLLPDPRVRVVVDRFAELAGVSASAVELRSGTLYVAVDASAGPVPFAVRTPATRVAVLGTSFGVRHDGAGTAVAVLEGRVRIVDATGGERVLEAGSEWLASGSPVALGDAWRADLVRALGDVDPLEPEECRLALAAPAPPPARSLPDSPATAGPSTDAPPPAPAGEPVPGPVSVPPSELPSGEELYRQAEAAMAAGRLEEAVALLERVADLERGRTLGGTALIDLAARYQRLGRPAEASATYRRYLAEHPGGTFRGEARISLCRLERQAGDQPAACACYAAYLEEQPAGPFAAEAAAGATGSGDGAR